jgi:hypothetical protein
LKPYACASSTTRSIDWGETIEVRTTHIARTSSGNRARAVFIRE